MDFECYRTNIYWHKLRYSHICQPLEHLEQRSLTWSSKIKLFKPAEPIFIDNLQFQTTKKNFKIGPLGPKEKINFFSFFLMRKRLSSGQKWFLRPYFPLIRGMFVFRSGLRFSFRALEVPQPRVRKRPFSLTKKIHRDKFNESQSMFLPLVSQWGQRAGWPGQDGFCRWYDLRKESKEGFFILPFP